MPARDLARQRRMDLADLARFALDLVAEDVRIDARRSREPRGRVERLLRRGDEMNLVAGERRIARLRSLERAAFQSRAYMRRDGDRVAVDDGERVGARGRIGHRRA